MLIYACLVNLYSPVYIRDPALVPVLRFRFTLDPERLKRCAQVL